MDPQLRKAMVRLKDYLVRANLMRQCDPLKEKSSREDAGVMLIEIDGSPGGKYSVGLDTKFEVQPVQSF